MRELMALVVRHPSLALLDTEGIWLPQWKAMPAVEGGDLCPRTGVRLPDGAAWDGVIQQGEAEQAALQLDELTIESKGERAARELWEQRAAAASARKLQQQQQPAPPPERRPPSKRNKQS